MSYSTENSPHSHKHHHPPHPTLYINENLRPRKGKGLAQGHSVTENRGSLTSSPLLLL